MIKELKALWKQLTVPEEFIGVTTDDRILAAVPEHQSIYFMQVWVARSSCGIPAVLTEVYIEATNTDEDTVTYAPTNNPGDSKIQNRKMFLRHYQPMQPDSRYDRLRGEVIALP